MFELVSSSLRVLVLDPIADQKRLGSRYCAGGYVWQIEDSQHGELLSGPCYPGETNAFDGQGLPEVFEIALGQHSVPVGGEVTVIGVGKVKRSSPVRPFHVRDNFEVAEFAKWEIAQDSENLFFRTEQEHPDQALRLTRRLQLKDRILYSTTEVENLAAKALPIRWFAHPFLPWDGLKVWRFSLETRLPSTQHWQQDEDGWISRRPEASAADGGFMPLVLPFGYPLTIEQKHPKLGQVRMVGDFALAWLPIWGNANTASCEPYFHTVVEPAGRSAWTLAYHF